MNSSVVAEFTRVDEQLPGNTTPADITVSNKIETSNDKNHKLKASSSGGTPGLKHFSNYVWYSLDKLFSLNPLLCCALQNAFTLITSSQTNEKPLSNHADYQDQIRVQHRQSYEQVRDEHYISVAHNLSATQD